MSIPKTKTQIGDNMQSEGSRMAEWVREQEDAPYEVLMAAIAMGHLVEEWTEIRRAAGTRLDPTNIGTATRTPAEADKGLS